MNRDDFCNQVKVICQDNFSLAKLLRLIDVYCQASDYSSVYQKWGLLREINSAACIAEELEGTSYEYEEE